MLKPVKSFKLEIVAIAGKPFFNTDDESATKETDSLDELIESEKTQLQIAFNGAKGEALFVDEFLQLYDLDQKRPVTPNPINVMCSMKREAEIERLRNVILCASNALCDSILCSGNDAQTNLSWVRRMEKELAPNPL